MHFFCKFCSKNGLKLFKLRLLIDTLAITKLKKLFVCVYLISVETQYMPITCVSTLV